MTTEFFYEMPSMIDSCKEFIQNRIEKDESIIFIAINEKEEMAGFTQIYPSFCSVEMKPILYLYDLFVSPNHRCHGAGKTLLHRAKELAEEIGTDRLTLETARDNESAQSLYKEAGYERDVEFYTYHLEI